MGEGDGRKVGVGSDGNLTVGGGAQLGRPVVGGSLGSELYLGNLPGGFDLNPVFFGDYNLDDYGTLGRRGAATIPRDAYLRIDQRFVTVRAGRISFLGGNIRSVDGAEVFVKPFSGIRLGGFAGMRNETALTPEGTLERRYRGRVMGVSAEGTTGGFSSRVFYQAVRDFGINTREDVGGSINWRILPGLSVFGNAMGSLLMRELEQAEGGARGTIGPVTLSGYYKWSDPSLLYFDTNDLWSVFASQPNWRTGGDVALRLLGGGFQAHAGGFHGSTVDFGVNAGAQVGIDRFLRTDFSFARNGTVVGGGDSVTAWLTGGLKFDRLQTLASAGYVQSPNTLMPLYSQGQAVGFLLSGDYRVSNSWGVGGRVNTTFPTDRSPQYTALLFLQWRPDMGHSAGAFGRNMGAWRRASVVPPAPVKKGEVSWVVFPVQVIDVGTVEAEGIKKNLHSYHAEGAAGCVDCHKAVPTSKLSSDNLTVMNCSDCHEDGRAVKVAITPPHLIFPHSTHVTDNKVACDRCHTDVKKVALATRAHLPTMSTCTSCHITWKTECSKCHPSGSSGRVQSIFPEGKLMPRGTYGIDDNHDVDFRVNGGHKWVATTHIDYCLNCHGFAFASPGEPKGCRECHDAKTISSTRQHPAGWLAYHPTASNREPSSCRTCHGQSFCSDCHTTQGLSGGAAAVAPRSYHPSGWLGVSGGDHGRRAAVGGAVACSPCHSAVPAASSVGAGQGTTCVSCHTSTANPHGTGMGGRLNRLQEVNPGLCKTCH